MLSNDIVTWGLMRRLLYQHLGLVFSSVSMGWIVAMIVGVLATRPKRRNGAFPEMLVRLLSLGQAIPSLAVLGLVMALFGIGFPTAIVALVLYALVPMLRNIVSGLAEVDEWVLDAARGMGMSKSAVLWKVEFPLALPAMMAGLRTAVVVTVSTAALSSQIGGGGFGRLIFMGIAMMDTGLMFMGALPTAVIAIGLDFALGRVERSLVGRRRMEADERRICR